MIKNEQKTFEQLVKPGTAKIYYAKRDHFGQIPSLATINETHAFIGTTNLTDKEEIYTLMQGGNWAKNGEANDYLVSKNVYHTSMSMGDVIEIDGIFYVVAMLGFETIG